EKPFEYFGAPWVDALKLAEELNSYSLKGVKFEPIKFIPSEKISAYPPKFFNQECNGVFINVGDKRIFEPVKCGVAIILALNKLFNQFKFENKNFIDKLAGTDKLRKMVINGNDYQSIINLWSEDLSKFALVRAKYLLYY
ncbi:MAG TPA: DUF1343 domain-containing protein, partial [Ignavibacteria bacterium]